jgi:adenylate kinase
MLRAAVQAETDIGRRAKGMMARGELVPDQVVVAAVIERISQPDAQRGFVLDGFLRTIAQAESFDDLPHTENMELDHVVELKVDEAVLLPRVMTRANEARQRGEAIRADDNYEALKIRLDAYNQQTCRSSNIINSGKYSRASMVCRRLMR